MNNILAFYNNLRNNSNSTNNNINLRRFAVLRLAMNTTDNILFSKYEQQVNAHNQEMLSNPFPNAGFDLFIPNTVTFDESVSSKFIDLKVKAEMIYCDLDSNSVIQHQYCGYLIHPRSSISKTPLMLANHTGIIDSGYRGSLIGAFRWLPVRDARDSNSYTVDAYTRLLQICHPSLCPILVEIVDVSQLAVTERGAGGFGSTGV